MSGSERLRVAPDPSGFAEAASRHSVVPLVIELLSDWWTPVSAFHGVAGEQPFAFLFESVEGGERIGRYSFLGTAPFLVARARDGRVTVEGEGAPRVGVLPGPPLEALRSLFARFSAPHPEGLPPFVSGAVGYFGYDTVRWVERLPDRGLPAAPEDDAMLVFLRDVAAFDHVRRRLFLVTNVWIDPEVSLDEQHAAGVERLHRLAGRLRRPAAPPEPGPSFAGAGEPVSTHTREQFEDAVRRAKELIGAGDIFQVVLSRRFRLPTAAGDLALYRSLRAINPSPYMFLLRLDGWSAVGSSPEPLLRVEGRRMRYRPIAGTVPRTGDPAEDEAAAARLLADPKERAEHVMLVDLGRNDLGRCAETGTVHVEELLAVERYSHVMHLVSGLTAVLRRDATALDALYACFPAGTVTGAPKVRAMEIIEELEPERRGIYAGAVGYLDFTGNLDTCIALRTMVLRDGEVTIRAGAGIVADSDPGREFEETRHKAEALVEAVRRAAGPWTGGR
jgi:anthranilate synthase component 1